MTPIIELALWGSYDGVSNWPAVPHPSRREIARDSSSLPVQPDVPHCAEVSAEIVGPLRGWASRQIATDP